MQKVTILICLIVSIITLSSTSSSANNEPVAQWKFDEGKGKHAIDNVTGLRDRIN